VPFARSVDDIGLAIPLFALAFASFFLLPLLASVVSGDAIAGEASGGTLKTILTRSVTRGDVFVAKVITAYLYTLALLLVQAVVGTIAGVLVLGADPLPTLSGTTVGVGRALALILVSFLFASLTTFALASFALLLSALTRNTIASIMGVVILIVVLQVVGSFESLAALRPYLVTEQTNAWFGFLREPVDWGPILRSVVVDLCWTVPCVAGAAALFLRRDVLG
jgi:ABC-2 type transport system permease protein